MARLRYVVDTSASARLNQTRVAAVIAPLVAARQAALFARWRALSLVDALVAAVAETRELTILHYDADFELVSELTGQPHEWVGRAGHRRLTSAARSSKPQAFEPTEQGDGRRFRRAP